MKLPPLLGRVWPLRTQLGMLVVGTLLPLLLFSGLVVRQLALETQSNIERRLVQSARTMSQSLDREVLESIDDLQGLGSSHALASGDWTAFREDARQVLRLRPAWTNITVASPDGTLVFDLETPPGAPTGSVRDSASFRRLIEDGSPVLGALRARSEASDVRFVIRVPVKENGRVRYAVSAELTPAGLAKALSYGSERDELTRTLVDSEGTVVFRDRSPEKFVGLRATANYLDNIQHGSQGVFRSVSLDGFPAYVAWSRSAWSWTSAVVVQREVIELPFWKSPGALIVFGLVALAISLAGAVLLSKRIRRGLFELERHGELLAHGGAPQPAPSGIQELDRLGEALAFSGEMLRARTKGLESAIRARDEFLSLASHELKTPITSLVLHAKLLKRAADKGDLRLEHAQRFLDQGFKQTGRLTRLIEDMLDISRISAGKLALEPEPFDLATLVSETVERLRPMLSDAGCTVTVTADGEVWGSWDRFRIEQVLNHLLSNAARFAPGSPVEVAVSRGPETATLEVRDYGRGIAPEDQERIFRKFERATDPTTTTGLGLGLHIVREVVEMHGGSVRVESTLGHGAAFVVTLPTAAINVDSGARSA